MIKDVMVRLDGRRADDERLAAANQIAEHFDSHIIGLYLNLLPLIAPADGDVGAAAAVRLVDEARVAGDKIEAELRQRMARLQKPVELRRFDTFSDAVGEIAAREARTADVLVAIRPNESSQESEDLVENVLFSTGRHLFLVPERKSAATTLDHIMIAWNGSREAARAVSEARPYLLKAKTVTIVIVNDSKPVEEQAVLGKDIAEHLLHHGIAAVVNRVTKNDGGVGATLIAESKRLKPDLIVMGGYGHSRLREWLLGGATYEMMHKAPAPLLIAH
jgi:nucleotide-binding universal stress UspA family protein